MLEFIDLDIPSLGYTRFISAWLYRGKAGTFIVDPGPAATVGHLIREIESRGVNRIDWVLLTHIHMDHAGGIGHLVEHFTDARVACHEKAVQHLVDPERLLAGSRKVLKEVAAAYGDIRPVPSGSIASGTTIDFEDGITVIPTPGHAPHHQCFAFRDVLFCGELFGVFETLGNDFYLRPATPPRFIFEDFLDSMQKIRPYADRKLCFGHYGSFPKGLAILAASRAQLSLWVEVIRSHMAEPDMDVIIDALMTRDPVFSLVRHLAGGQYEREMHFTKNSIRGIREYLGP